MELLVKKHDYRTPLEKALGVPEDLVVDRGLSSQQRARKEAIALLNATGISVRELPSGKWSIEPNYPLGATPAQKAAIDAACEKAMREFSNA